MSIVDNPNLAELERMDMANCLIKLDFPYSPRRRPWDQKRSKIFDLINSGLSRYERLLAQMGTFSPFFEKIQVRSEIPSDLSPRWVNGWFPGLDSISLYSLLAIHNPPRYVEVGSGNSTMFARQAIIDHGLQTSIVSIDPCPRADIDKICDRIIRSPCEDVDQEVFETLTSKDILFIDNSHRAFPNSDVTVFFTEILPNLPGGLIYGLHDIYLPWDYPDEWRDRYYNEQYLLSAYLLGGGGGDEIILPNAFVSYYAPYLMTALDETYNNPKLHGIEKTGGAFWLKRR
jgi:hypothetical protein